MRPNSSAVDITNTYLLEIIKAFNAQERVEMARFLDSPFFNQGRNAAELSKLFQIVVQAAPDFSKELLQKETLYFQVFDDPRIIPGKLEKLMTELGQMFQRYAVTAKFLTEANAPHRQVEWAAWLRSKNLGDRSLKVIEKLKKRRTEEQKESIELYRTNLQIAEEKHIWESLHNQAAGDLDIPEVIYHLEIYYQNYRTELQNRFLLQKKVAQLPSLEVYLESVQNTHPESILLKLSQGIFQVLKKDIPTLEETQELLTFLQEHEALISYDTLENLYTYLRNFYTLLINNSNDQFLPILHELNKDNLQRGYFLANGKISHHAYLNLVAVAIRVHDFEWAKRVTEQFKDSIVTGDEEGFYYKLNQVYCLFAEKRFEEALNCLTDPPAHSIFHARIRRLEIQLYFELKSDLLTYKIDAFRKYNERTASKSISAQLKEMNVNFLNLILQLSQSPPKDKVRAAQLINRINSKKRIAERSWLLEKARELG